MQLSSLRNRWRRLRRLRKSSKSDAGLYRIVRAAPAMRAERGLCCATILKDEADYLDEWLAFHRVVGFDHFVIYDNGSTDDTRRVLEPWERDGQVTVIPWRNFSDALHPQKAANAHAVANFGERWRWMAFFDVDEFLFSPTHDTVPEALDAIVAAHGDLPVISTPWHNFGFDGHDTRPDGLVIESYRERNVFPPLPEQRSLLRYKSVLDPTRVESAATHAFAFEGLGPALINERGERMRVQAFEDREHAVSEHLRLNHYFTRSREEMARRHAKGRVSSRGAVVEGFADNRLAQYELARERDETIQRLVPAVRALLASRGLA